ncbi:dinucleotide-utilizing enzyme [Microbacterium sp. R86528]|uniref:dinucleotide-utilizing enzyme n=1 Tax=Microbacterium sp. R86528 TaxID=3093864 RepID=UPI0037C97229
MNTRPALVRSIPFWALIVASLASLAYGVSLVTDKIAVMTVTLTEGTATGVEVYVGQSIALLGSILIGVGVLGLLIALAIAAASTLRAHPPVEVVEPIDWDNQDEVAVDAPAPAAYEPASVDEVVEPVTEAEPVVVAETADEVIVAEPAEPAAEQANGAESSKS